MTTQPEPSTAEALFSASDKLRAMAAAGNGVSLTPGATHALAEILFSKGRVALFVLEHADAQTIAGFATHPHVVVARSELLIAEGATRG